MQTEDIGPDAGASFAWPTGDLSLTARLHPLVCSPLNTDFDGDMRNDYAVYRPSDNTWYFILSSNGNIVVRPFGAAGEPLDQLLDVRLLEHLERRRLGDLGLVGQGELFGKENAVLRKRLYPGKC